jgi:DNA-binding NtrC family response regulator
LETSAGLFEVAGLSAVACPNAGQAFELLEKNPYQAVFYDLRAPGMDGMEFMRRVHQRSPNVAFVMVTRPEDVRYGILAMLSGASDYIQAPLDPRAVIASLARALRRKYLERVSPKQIHVPGDDVIPAGPSAPQSATALHSSQASA